MRSNLKEKPEVYFIKQRVTSILNVPGSKKITQWNSKTKIIFISEMILQIFSTRPNSARAAAESPPKAVPLHTRPVTSWKGRVEISCPAPATPMMTLSPHPLWQASRAALYENGHVCGYLLKRLRNLLIAINRVPKVAPFHICTVHF